MANGTESLFTRLVRSRRFAVGAAVSASLLAATTAGAVAGIPGPNGLIQGCYNNALGILRVVPAASQCITVGNPLLFDNPRLLETPLAWNQTGPQGLQGAPGVAGPQGPKGDTGAMGLPGATGPAGLTGAKGDTGATGATGAIGPQGLKGDAGANGAVGATGPVGPVGPVGPAGPSGAVGAIGVPGLTGAVGPAGPQGPPGPAGPIGPSGTGGSGFTSFDALNGLPCNTSTAFAGVISVSYRGGLVSLTCTPSRPVITNLAPTSGSFTGGMIVAITGSGFSTTATTFSFGSVAASGISCTSTTTCTAVSPAAAGGTLGTVDVIATVGGQSSPALVADQFAYIGPTVTGLSPSSEPDIVGGSIVSITGTGFSTVPGTTTVTFGPNAASGVSCLTQTQCTASSPAGTGGTVDVIVTVNGVQSPVVAADRFAYIAQPTPAVAGISPNSGPAVGGTAVSISGTGFGIGLGPVAVKFGPNFAVNVQCIQISCTAFSPPGSGTVHVTVIVNGLASSAGPFDQFTYLP